ncbi:MAG: AbrB family transcriptional regulator [Gammaproteobacteria bacterium]|nr:AbrB family transcriptional regulator [Gammaproteobacteria bacterium]
MLVAMKLQITKWGNSLAVRLPAEFMRAIGAKAGDSIEAEISTLGKITLTPVQHFDKAAFLKRTRKLRSGMPVTSATVEAMRKDERY